MKLSTGQSGLNLELISLYQTKPVYGKTKWITRTNGTVRYFLNTEWFGSLPLSTIIHLWDVLSYVLLYAQISLILKLEEIHRNCQEATWDMSDAGKLGIHATWWWNANYREMGGLGWVGWVEGSLVLQCIPIPCHFIRISNYRTFSLEGCYLYLQAKTTFRRPVTCARAQLQGEGGGGRRPMELLK